MIRHTHWICYLNPCFLFLITAGGIFPILPVGWTLIIEVFVYILFYLAFRIVRFIGLCGERKRLYVSIGVFFCFILMGQMVISYFNFTSPVAYVWMSVYQYSFVFGMLINCYLKNTHSEYETKGFVLIDKSALFICGGIMVGMSYVDEIYPVIFAMGIVLVCSGLKNLMAPAVFVKIGDISFSFYLVHKFVISFLEKVIRSLHLMNPVIESFFVLIISFAGTIVVATIMHEIFECRISRKLSDILFDNISTRHGGK